MTDQEKYLQMAYDKGYDKGYNEGYGHGFNEVAKKKKPSEDAAQSKRRNEKILNRFFSFERLNGEADEK